MTMPDGRMGSGLEVVTSSQILSNATNASIVEMGKQLLAASRDGLGEDVSSLLDLGAPMTTDWLGTSPLHLAAAFGHAETAGILMRSGCSRDARTKVDKTPLHLAATEGHASLVDLLLKSGAEVDTKDMLRMTPLHWAVERRNLDSVQILIEHGADVNLENKFGKCPLELAAETGISDLYELLQNAEHIRATARATALANNTVPDPVTLAATDSIARELTTTTTTSPNSADVANQEEAMKLLAAHGITLLPDDPGETRLMDSAIGDRQTLTLTEAGKLALTSDFPVMNSPAEPKVVRAAAPNTTKSPHVAKYIAINPSTASRPLPPVQPAKSIVINTSRQQHRVVTPQSSGRKATRVIKVTPEQFAAIKAGRGAGGHNKLSLSGLGKTASKCQMVPSSPAFRIGQQQQQQIKIEPQPIATQQRKTIKIVRVNSTTGGTPNIQLIKSEVVNKQALLQKKLAEIDQQSEVLRRQKEELMRQLGT